MFHDLTQQVEHGLEAVKQYMSEKMTESNNKTPTKKKLWGIGKMVKYKTFHGFSSSPGRSPGRRTGGDRHREEREGFINVSDYRQIDGLASPRHVSLFNPRRLLSPLSTFFSPPRYQLRLRLCSLIFTKPFSHVFFVLFCMKRCFLCIYFFACRVLFLCITQTFGWLLWLCLGSVLLNTFVNYDIDLQRVD